MTMSSAHDYEPKTITSLMGISVTQIACGEHHYLALDSNGDVYSWGTPSSQYNKGQLGHGDRQSQEQPKRIESLENSRCVKIACGGYHSLVLTSEDEIFAFGSGAYGERGQGDTKDYAKPKLVELIPTVNQMKQNKNDDDYTDDFLKP